MAIFTKEYTDVHECLKTTYGTFRLYIWSLSGDNRLTVKTKAHHNEEILCYSVNKSGTMLVTGSVDQSLKCWLIETGFLTQVCLVYRPSILPVKRSARPRPYAKNHPYVLDTH